MNPFRRLAAADPALRLSQQPDERAEQDLQTLTGELPARNALGRPTTAPTARRGFTSVVVTTAVSALVLLVVGAVLTGGPRTVGQPAKDGTTQAGRTTAQPTLPPYPAADCDPAKVLPFKCGTYSSTYGGAAVTGLTGGPVQDPLQISFTPVPGQADLLLQARTRSCFTATMPVTFQDGRLKQTGTALFGVSGMGCAPHKGDDVRRNWAFTFLRSTLTTTDATTFGSGASSVFFQYDGIAPIGQPQLPRNDLDGCVGAHITPFRCGDYRSTSGTGTLAFLASAPYRLTFNHVNGQLEASFIGACNALSAALAVRGDHVTAGGGGSTLIGCPGVRAQHDGAVSSYFEGELRFEQNRDVVTFTSPNGTATFTRE